MREPTGGTIRDLLFFGDSIPSDIRLWDFAVSQAIDTSIYHDGTASFQLQCTPWNGMHFWYHGGGDTTWGGPHDRVFWVQPNSVLTMWVRSSIANQPIKITAAVESTEICDVFVGAICAQANTWYQVSFPIPAEARDFPLKAFKFYEDGGNTVTFWFDNVTVTSVRLDAGLGNPIGPDMDGIAASQVGYGPNMYKQFVSPVEFTDFQVVDENNNVVLTGGGPLSTVLSDVTGIQTMVWVGDFTDLTTPGTYRIRAGGLESYPFAIGENVFDGVARAVQRMFYFQRAFTAIEQPYAEGPWVHPSDANKAAPGVVKGWHDAGDYTIYNATMTQAIFFLLEAERDFGGVTANIPESGNGTPDILNEARWGLEWLLSVQDAGGGFHTNCGVRNSQYNGEGSTTPNNLRGAYVKTGITTQATLKAVAVLAYAYKSFLMYDQAFADQCLNAARRGWDWATANPASYQDTVTNDNGSPWAYDDATNPDIAVLTKTNRMWAAAALFFATGESAFDYAFHVSYESPTWIASYGISHVYGAAIYYQASGGDLVLKSTIYDGFAAMANAALSDSHVHPFSWATHYYWGSLNNGAQRAYWEWKLIMWNDMNMEPSYANHHVDYLLGCNFRRFCYVSGIGANGMQEAFHHWLKALNATPHCFPGMIGAGPNQSPDPNDSSTPSLNVYRYWGDNRTGRNNERSQLTALDGRATDNDSWSTNEQVISWNAVNLYNILGMRVLAGGTTPPPPPPDDLEARVTTLEERLDQWEANYHRIANILTGG